MVADPPEPVQPAAPTISWDLVLQALGVGAAVAGWIAVVGGARVWARLEAAHIPATQTLAGLPRELFVVEGLQMLLFPLLLGGSVAVFVLFSLRRKEQSAEETERRVQERLAFAEDEAKRTARTDALASRALDQARTAAIEVTTPQRESSPAVIKEANERVRDGKAHLEQATEAAEKARGRLKDVQRQADQATRTRSISPDGDSDGCDR